MLSITQFTFNLFEENTYLITNAENECWIVDPGMYEQHEKQELFGYIRKKDLKPQAIINTHAHLDHIFGLQAVIDEYGIPFGLHHKELPVLDMGVQSAALFGFHLNELPRPNFYISEEEPLTIGTETLQIRFAPGHSPGSIVFYYPQGKWAIGGDVLFSGSIGRTDLPGGNFDTLIHSIRTQLFTLPGDVRVFAGHGPSTTIKHEMQHNPFLNAG